METTTTEKRSPVEEVTIPWLVYETKISKLLTEITSLKVVNKQQKCRIDELESLLKSSHIPLPEEQDYLKEHEAEIQKSLEEKQELEVESQAGLLKWTAQGVEGMRDLMKEMTKMTYPNLEVLDISGNWVAFFPSLDMHIGDEGCKLLAKFFSQGWSLVNIFQFYFSPPTMPRLHTIILYGNDIGKEGAHALISAFRYLPQIELLGLEVLSRGTRVCST